jgi:ABC-type transport system substrate-binding protein
VKKLFPGALFSLLALAALPGGQETRGGVKAGTDTLMLTYLNDPNTINPIIANDSVSEDFLRWVSDPLADRKFSNPDEFEPVLAERWEFDEKNLEYTIHLRKGVKWHPSKYPDGSAIPSREFTSEDVKFTFDCIVNKHVDAASLRSYYEDPEARDESEKIKIRVTVVDLHTLKVKWTKPYIMSEEFTLGVPIIPKHIFSLDDKGEPLSLDVASEEFAKGFNDHWANSIPSGTGPMMISAWKKNDRLELARNPDYWGKPFYFSKVVFRNIPNLNTSRQMLLNGELDSASIPDKDLYLQTKDQPAVKEGKVLLDEYDYPVYRYIGWNFKREIFKNRAVRTALAHAIPVQQIIDKVLHGLGQRLSGPFLPTSDGYDNSLPPVSYDLDKARQLLDDAGWKDSTNNGIRDKSINGKQFELRFDFMISADIPTYKTIAEIVKEEFRKIGVDVQISPVKWTLMLEKLHKKEFDVCMLGWALSWKQDLFQIWHGSQADVPESSNAIGYRNPELDKLIETQRTTFDPERQRELCRKMHKIIYDDQPYAFLFVEKQTAGHRARIKNVNFYKIRPCKDAREWHAPSTEARN